MINSGKVKFTRSGAAWVSLTGQINSNKVRVMRSGESWVYLLGECDDQQWQS